MWEGVGDRKELQHIDPHSIGHNRVSFPFSWAAQPGAWGPTLLGAGFLYRTLSPTNWLPVFTELYNNSTPIFLWASQIAFIQPIHGQGYHILIDWMHLLFTKVHFLFWQPGRVVGQHTTRWNHKSYNFKLYCSFCVCVYYQMHVLKFKWCNLHLNLKSNGQKLKKEGERWRREKN